MNKKQIFLSLLLFAGSNVLCMKKIKIECITDVLAQGIEPITSSRIRIEEKAVADQEREKSIKLNHYGIEIMSIMEAEARGLELTTSSQTGPGCIIGMQKQAIDQKMEHKQQQRFCDELSGDEKYFTIKKAITEFLQKTSVKKIKISILFETSLKFTGKYFPAKEALQEYRDNEGNSITHLLVKHGNADALFDCAINKIITFAPNKAGKTPFDIIDHQTKKCCISILTNYDKSQIRGDGEYLVVEKCCDDHEKCLIVPTINSNI